MSALTMISRLLPTLTALLILGGVARHSVGEETSFRQVLNEQTRQTLKTIQNYIQTHPNASDLPQAYAWLFTSARANGLESLVLAETEQCLQAELGGEPLQRQARQVRSLGLAAQGELDEAMTLFQQELRNVRLRSPQETVDYGIALASKAQLGGKPEMAVEILNAVSRAFFLNSAIERMCKNRVTRMEMIGSEAPAITVEDMAGRAISLDDYAGKVVVVDFWATNCLPCLEQFPAMKTLYQAEQKNGLEILGISLDSEAQMVEQFQETWALPWPLMLSTTDQDATRRRYEAPAIPAVVVIDRQGKIAAVDLTGTDLEQMVRKLLARDANVSE